MKQLIAPIIASLFIITSFIYGQNNEKASVSVRTSVPIVSQEEAGKANDEALRVASRRPINGTIKAISHTISPETAAYDDCNFTLLLSSDDDNEFFITVPMFLGRQFTPFAKKKVGDTLKVSLIPFDETSKDIQEIQNIDDINDFEKEMYYADSSLDDLQKELHIDSKKKEEWIKRISSDVEKEIRLYHENIKDSRQEIDQGIEYYKSGVFHAKQESYGYFCTGNYVANTDHYNPTLLQGIKDLQKKCEKFNCTLVVIPCVVENEYAKKELIASAKSLPFIDVGRESFVLDLLKNNILAIDTNRIICNHQAANYLPFSMRGDAHFSQITNLFIADEIASNLGIKRNEYTIKTGYFSMSSMHLPYYSGPHMVLTEPVFNEPFQQDTTATDILIAGDSYTSTNNFNSYLSSLTLGNITTIRHDARSNVTLQELLDGKYDSQLNEASLVVFIFAAAYMKGNYPTQELVDTLSSIKNNEVLYYNVPSPRSKSLTISMPDVLRDAKTIKIVVYTTPVLAKYTIKINDKACFEYDCDFRYNSGENNILLNVSSEDFIDGQLNLTIDGNASFRKVILAGSSS